MKVKIAQVQPNPFRDLSHYPIDREKVGALKRSIESTSFWDNLVARPQNGNVEIAYGHHRLVALRELFPADHEIDVIARDLDDATMLRIMANENLEEWGTSAWVELETVAAVIRAYGEGKIQLDTPAVQTNSGSIHGTDASARAEASSGQYTAQTVANFLGWTAERGKPQEKVYTAVNALALIKQGVLTESQFYGISTFEARALVQTAQKTLRNAHADAKRKEADRQRKAAEQAGRERAKAEAEQERQARAEQVARDATTRAEAATARADAGREAAAAAQREAQARKQAEASEHAAEEQRRKGVEDATRAAQQASEALKSGAKTARQVAAEASAYVSHPVDQHPKRMDLYARRVAAKLAKVLADDQLGNEVRELLRYRDQLAQGTRSELVALLRAVRDRANVAARSFEQPQHYPTPTAAPAALPSPEPVAV